MCILSGTNMQSSMTRWSEYELAHPMRHLFAHARSREETFVTALALTHPTHASEDIESKLYNPRSTAPSRLLEDLAANSFPFREPVFYEATAISHNSLLSPSTDFSLAHCQRLIC